MQNRHAELSSRVPSNGLHLAFLCQPRGRAGRRFFLPGAEPRIRQAFKALRPTAQKRRPGAWRAPLSGVSQFPEVHLLDVRRGGMKGGAPGDYRESAKHDVKTSIAGVTKKVAGGSKPQPNSTPNEWVTHRQRGPHALPGRSPAKLFTTALRMLGQPRDGTNVSKATPCRPREY